MKLVFYSPVLNHHQGNLADEFYKILGVNYTFVETSKCGDSKGVAEDYSSRPYLLRSWKSKKACRKAMFLALNSDVCVFGGHEALSFERARMKRGLLSFDMGERWLKRGWLNLASPRILKMLLTYHLCGWSKKPLFKLCCGAFAAADQRKLKTFGGKCFKWGYFTKAREAKYKEIEFNVADKTLDLMWSARFLKWKHPEMVVKLAERLKVEGYKFHIKMYGEGVMRTYIAKLIDNFGLTDRISLMGEVSNEQIQEAMTNSDIFLFTSDEEEGWGVVANEAMSNKCCLVGSDKTGAVPYLVKDGVNGMVFKSESENSFYQQVKYLIEHPAERQMMAERGYLDLVNLWSPKHAASNLLKLIQNLQLGCLSGIEEGPCSNA